jgi:hypothetical protein
MKSLKYITILLFALAAVWMGCHQVDSMKLRNIIDSPKAIIVKKIQPNYSDSITINLHIILNNQRILGKMIFCRQKRDEYEIKYLRTGDEKYFILGNKYVDSLHYYAKQAL